MLKELSDMAAIKDVAKLANVSVGTVSRYLNNAKNLSPEYRDKVESAIKTLNYKPSRLAQAMRTKRTNMIALVVPEMQNQFYIELYNAIRLACYQQGYIPIMYTMEAGIQMLQHLFSGSGAAQFDGIIFAFMDDEQNLDLISHYDGDIPFILMTCKPRDASVYSVIVSDVYDGGYQAARHILEMGHTRIAYVGHTDNPLNMNEKLAGVKRAFAEGNLLFDPDYYIEGMSTYATGYNSAHKLMRMPSPPTAVITGNDMLAAGVLKYLLEHNYRVPDDVAVIGYDGIKLGTVCSPSLSTVAQPIEGMGQAAVDQLLQKINQPDSGNIQSIFKPRLIVRQSTKGDAPSTLSFS